MNNAEFSARFDAIVNSYNQRADKSSIADLKFDEYEKSVFLTSAEYDLCRDYYSGKNAYWQSFEDNEAVRVALEALVKTYVTSEQQKSTSPRADEESMAGDIPLTSGSYLYKKPEDAWYVIEEQVDYADNDNQCISGKTVLVQPVRHDDLWKLRSNPFKGPSNNRVLRLNIGNNLVELVSNYPIASYKLRYIKKPTPIILTALPDDLSIEGLQTVSECELNPVVHDLILNLAVKNAIQSRAIGAMADSQK
jgi:hypothetical protein